MNWPRGLCALWILDPGLRETEKSLRTVESRAPGHLLFLSESLLVRTPFLCVMASWMLPNAEAVGQGGFACPQLFTPLVEDEKWPSYAGTVSRSGSVCLSEEGRLAYPSE